MDAVIVSVAAEAWAGAGTEGAGVELLGAGEVGGVDSVSWPATAAAESDAVEVLFVDAPDVAAGSVGVVVEEEGLVELGESAGMSAGADAEAVASVSFRCHSYQLLTSRPH